MKRRFSIFMALATTLPVLAQDPANRAAAINEQREADERYRSLSGIVEQLQEAYSAQTRRLNGLSSEINTLREQSRDDARKATANLATREELKRLAEQVQEIDKKREADTKLILEKIERLAKIASTPAPVIVTPAAINSSDSESRPHKPVSNDVPEGNYYMHKVKKGESLSAIIAAFNTKLKAEGKPTVTFDAVKKANPTMDPNNVIIGRTIRIPAGS